MRPRFLEQGTLIVMKNFIQSGHHIDINAPAGGLFSGAGVIVGSLFGVAASAAVEGALVSVTTTGVFDLPKLGAAVFAVGDPVSWDQANGQCVAPGAGFFPIGAAIGAAGADAGAVKVRLDGIATKAAA